MSAAQLEERTRVANSFFLDQGIGFTVYGDDAGTDRISPSTSSPGSCRAMSGRPSSGASSSGCAR